MPLKSIKQSIRKVLELLLNQRMLFNVRPNILCFLLLSFLAVEQGNGGAGEQGSKGARVAVNVFIDFFVRITEVNVY